MIKVNSVKFKCKMMLSLLLEAIKQKIIGLTKVSVDCRISIKLAQILIIFIIKNKRILHNK